jgi:hypothetical protein
MLVKRLLFISKGLVYHLIKNKELVSELQFVKGIPMSVEYEYYLLIIAIQWF